MIDTFAQHEGNPFFTAEEDTLLVGGRKVTAIAAELGTPFYVYDSAVIARQIDAVRAAFPREVGLHYAVKANPMRELVAFVAARVDGLDVASALELDIALASGKDISFAGPGKRRDEIAQAINAGIVLNVESPRELRVIGEEAARLGKRPRVALRVNPDFELKPAGMKMSGGPRQFGIDAEAVPALLGELGDVEFVGFHVFSGSQNLRVESIVEAQRKSFALAVELAAHAPAPVRTLNLGGGLGIPYYAGDKRLALQPIGASLAALVDEAKRALPEAQLVIELGRFLVGEAGVYVCRVIDRKVSRGKTFLVADGGLHHHLAASGNFGQMIRRDYPVLVANKVRGTEREHSSVVGPLCTPLDILADQAEMARAEEGDLIAVFMSGAYGLTASPLRFLGHPAPGELLV